MANYTLTSEPPLSGVDHSFGQTHITSPADLAIVSIALPLGAEKAALTAVKTVYGVDLPEVGKSAASKAHDAMLSRLAIDQAFVLFPHTEPTAAKVVGDLLNGMAYVTDQTDVWSALQISGPQARTALERICPLNLHPASFAIHDVARTVMEHLGVVILRTGDDTYLLLSASSSAGSFLHAIETSLTNVT